MSSSSYDTWHDLVLPYDCFYTWHLASSLPFDQYLRWTSNPPQWIWIKLWVQNSSHDSIKYLLLVNRDYMFNAQGQPPLLISYPYPIWTVHFGSTYHPSIWLSNGQSSPCTFTFDLCALTPITTLRCETTYVVSLWHMGSLDRPPNVLTHWLPQKGLQLKCVLLIYIVDLTYQRTDKYFPSHHHTMNPLTWIANCWRERTISIDLHTRKRWDIISFTCTWHVNYHSNLFTQSCFWSLISP